MGVPKFFRWMSERYPLISQLVQENSIPEFDNLYLDMNGIIHHCSHPNEGDAHFRITEEAIFLAIFSYLEHLFSLIKPQKLFFLAVDGVAPRAKMNQQRSRRFKSAKENEDIVEKALKRGEELPGTEGFDSNCITPGTPFMVRLSEQLKYFINKKVSEDSAWRNVRVVLSGHEVPGEGEHKIMEYIRIAKAQPDYDPNVRHCLYGLDADLIMLALLSHDPHFCLLREEVTFGPKKAKTKGSVESHNFYLLHVSLLREYLDLEFSSLKDDSAPLPFGYDLERIIDDFILLCIFVGNDFLPHLPGLHINEGALGLLFGIYKNVLPRAGGYLNEHGTLNGARLQLVLDELQQLEMDAFEHECADSSWFKGKQRRHIESVDCDGAGAQLVLTQNQRKLFNLVKTTIRHDARLEAAPLLLPNELPARDRKFLQDLVDELQLDASFDQFDASNRPVITITRRPSAFDLSEADTTMTVGAATNQTSETSGVTVQRPEVRGALNQVLKKYERAPTAKPFDEKEFETEHARKLREKRDEWKALYYREKLGLSIVEKKHIERLAFSWIEGLQWVLRYYYDGVASWSWYYPYHYAPKISDLTGITSYRFHFDLGSPFKPFQQLMGVLPQLSSAHVPQAFRGLMSEPDSPILDFYPKDFETDLNGKKQVWEAIVKIPFIDERRLIQAMAARETQLTAEERARNTFGCTWQFTYDASREVVYPSSLPGFFPELHHCHAVMAAYDLPTLGGHRLVKGLREGVLLGKDALAGFPSLHNLPFSGQLRVHGVNVFQSESRNETMVIAIDNVYESAKPEELATGLIGQHVYVGYPFLREARVTAVSDALFRYERDSTSRISSLPHRPEAIMQWRKSADQLERVYSKRRGVLTQNVDIVLHVKLLKGLQRVDDGALVKEFEQEESEYALQVVVLQVSAHDLRYREQAALPIAEEFPVGSKIFFLGAHQYGAPAQVVEHHDNKLAIRIVYFPSDKQERFIFRGAIQQASEIYYPSHAVSRRLGIGALALSKITSSLMVTFGDSKLNLGLNLKFEAKAQKVLGFTRRGDSGWEYSEKAIALVADYKACFPEVIEALERRRGDDLTRAEDFFSHAPAGTKIAALKSWLQGRGVSDFERVSLYAEMLDSQAIKAIEAVAGTVLGQRTPASLKHALIRGIPRKAVVKPAHASERLDGQTFQLGDRVVMVSESGNVPLSAKGVVVGLSNAMVEVVWDTAFIGGTTLGNRCSEYRGQAVPSASLLNLTLPQFAVVVGEFPKAPAGGGVVRGHGPFTRGRGVQPQLVPRGAITDGTRLSSSATQPVRHILSRPPDRTSSYAGTAGGRAAFRPTPTPGERLQSTLSAQPFPRNYTQVPPPRSALQGNRGTRAFRSRPRARQGSGRSEAQ